MSGLTMEGSFNSIHGSKDNIIPQEDPRSKKFSTQYDYSLHSVPMKSSGHFSKTGDAIKKIGSGASKHHRKRRHRRNKHNRLETEDINPSDVVAEILGNFL